MFIFLGRVFRGGDGADSINLTVGQEELCPHLWEISAGPGPATADSLWSI
jgi:hypothetical protein